MPLIILPGHLVKLERLCDALLTAHAFNNQDALAHVATLALPLSVGKPADCQPVMPAERTRTSV